MNVIKHDAPEHMQAIEYELVPQAIVLYMARDLIQDLYMTVPISDELWKVPVMTSSPHSQNSSQTTGLGLSLEAGPSATGV